MIYNYLDMHYMVYRLTGLEDLPPPTDCIFNRGPDSILLQLPIRWRWKNGHHSMITLYSDRTVTYYTQKTGKMSREAWCREIRPWILTGAKGPTNYMHPDCWAFSTLGKEIQATLAFHSEALPIL